MRWFLLSLVVLSAFPVLAQQESHNGWHLPPSGFIRVLVIYAEVDYDVHPKSDPHGPDGIKRWRPGQLPVYADELFDPHPDMANSRGIVTQFFNEASFGQYTVVGDYLSSIVTVKESNLERYSKGDYVNGVIAEANSRKYLQTKSGFTSIEDFDHLSVTKPGQPKHQPSIDDPKRYDHIMVVFRNLHLESVNSGWANRSSLPELYGFKSDTYTVFRVGGAVPFYIARHEFAHLLFGSNNFHVGGGQHNGGGRNHFIATQGGWSCLGGANSSFLTCNAWDRDRMGWKLPDKQHSISAINAGTGLEANGRIDGGSGGGDYLLRDFVTTGDALCIKLPGIPAGEYQQYIWVENHQTYRNNGSRFDRFHYQHWECIDEPTAGLYMYLQVGKDTKAGKNIYGDWGDYLRPISAEGFYDYQYLDEKVKNQCINTGQYPPFEKQPRYENPLTGSHDQEFPTLEQGGDGRIQRGDGMSTVIERVSGTLQYNYPQLGDRRDAFTKSGVRKIGMGTNPSTASMMTMVSLDDDYYRGKLPNNRSVWLNGISIEILEERPDGSIVVRVRTDDVEITESRRWCADAINLPVARDSANYSLIVARGRKITLDRGETATRVDNPETVDGQPLFNSATTLHFHRGTRALLREKAALSLEAGSTLNMRLSARIELEKGASVRVDPGCTVKLAQGATLAFEKNATLVMAAGSELHIQAASIASLGTTTPTLADVTKASKALGKLKKSGRTEMEIRDGGWLIIKLLDKAVWSK